MLLGGCATATGKAQAEGRGVSRPTASAATGSVTVKANIVYQHNRKLRGAHTTLPAAPRMRSGGDRMPCALTDVHAHAFCCR